MKLKLAILDLYNGIPNQGMRCIFQLVNGFADAVSYDVFDVRKAGELPGLDYDIYISSGGPGDPREGEGEGEGGWDERWGDWLDGVLDYNAANERKKYVLFICHSFQMAVHHMGLAEVCARRSISFGTFRVHSTEEGRTDKLFGELEDPFMVADFRRFQVIQPDEERMAEVGATVLALEKERPHVPLERAVMAIRWSPEIVGTQFHPEADAEGMLTHFSRPDIKAEVIRDHGRHKWLKLIADLSDPEKIARTHDVVIPGFLRRAVEALGVGVQVGSVK